MSQEIIIRKGPKTKEEKGSIIKQIQNLIITGEIHENTFTQNAEDLGISRYTLREYLPLAYQSIDLDSETQIKRVKDTRQFLIDSLMNDFKICDDPALRNVLSKNINSLLDSQEKSSLLIMQSQKENESIGIQTAQPKLFTDFLSKLSDKKVIEMESNTSNT